MKLPETYKPLQTVKDTKRFWLFFSPAAIFALFTITIGLTAVPAGNVLGTNIAIALAVLSFGLFITAFTFGTIDYRKPEQFEKDYDLANKEWIKAEFLPWVEQIIGHKKDYLFARNMLTCMPENESVAHRIDKVINLYYLSMDEDTRELSIRHTQTDGEAWDKLRAEIQRMDTSGANA